MANTLYRDTGYSLTHLIEEIKHGKIALPDIQRAFVWTDKQVRDLFDSLYRGYPVGTLMFWETGVDGPVRHIGTHQHNNIAKLLIIDGQQRLTSLYTVLTGQPVLTKSYEQRYIRIAFRPRDEAFEVSNSIIENDPEFIPDITTLWNEGHRTTVRRFFARLNQAYGLDPDDPDQRMLEDRIYQLHDIHGFRFQTIELNASTTEEQAAEIFVRINYQGIRLERLDFILTLMSVYWDRGRKQLESFCRSAIEPRRNQPTSSNALIEPAPDQLLRVAVGLAFRRGRLQQVYDILRGKDLRTGLVSRERREEQFEELRRAQNAVLDLDNWHSFLKCLLRAGFRSSRMIASQNALIFSYVFWLVGRHEFHVSLPVLRRVIARWFFMVHTTSRYTGSVEAQFESDLARISTLEDNDGEAFCNELNRIVQSNFGSDYWGTSLPNLLDNSSTKSSALCSYWAALNILGARALFGETLVSELFDGYSSIGSLVRERLFSRSYLIKAGESRASIQNAVANMTFIEWPESLRVDQDDPSDYWPTLTRTLDSKTMERYMYWHGLPNGWEHYDYDNFLRQRRRLVAKVIRDAYEYLWVDDDAAKRPTTLADFLANGESNKVEYKSTLSWNPRSGRRDKRLEHAILKTVCGFMNTEGGMLLIGVSDDAEVLGLHDDMRALNNANRDKYERVLRQVLENNLSIPTVGIVNVKFEEYGGRDVCMVSVSASGRAIFAAPVGGRDLKELWVRDGTSTRQLHGDDMIAYMSERWD